MEGVVSHLHHQPTVQIAAEHLSRLRRLLASELLRNRHHLAHVTCAGPCERPSPRVPILAIDPAVIAFSPAFVETRDVWKAWHKASTTARSVLFRLVLFCLDAPSNSVFAFSAATSAAASRCATLLTFACLRNSTSSAHCELPLLA